jgi:hypothetical protein
MSAKRLLFALALVAAALTLAPDWAAAQGIPTTTPKFTPGGNGTFRGPFPGFNQKPPAGASATNPALPTVTVIPGVASAGGVVTPANYLGNNLGSTMDSTYQTIVQMNSLQTLQQNQGQFGQFGNLGSLGGVLGGALGALGGAKGALGGGALGALGALGGGALGALGGGALGILGGAGGKFGAGGALGALGAFGSRYYGL